MMVYKQSQQGAAAASGPVEMEVQVLTTGYWPVYPHYPNLILPESLREPQERFSNHYKTKYQGRRITWQYSLGHCVVRANGFGNKSYDLIVSLCQALVLTQFHDFETTLGIRKLMELVGMEDRDEMERILLSLSSGKEGTRILHKIDFEQDKKKRSRTTIDDRDSFQIFAEFESNQRRIRITNIMMKETKEEREKTVDAISRDRLYLIDAVLVRIMKARKTILHTLLISEVLTQLKVPAQAADVKKRIETLIEREYMERDAKDRNRYNYLA
jgi:cullin-4